MHDDAIEAARTPAAARRRAGTWGARGLVASAAVAAAALLSSGTGPQGAGDSDVGRARNTLTELAETQRLISKERRDWKVARELLLDRIDVVKREIESLRADIGQAQASIAEADEKRAELIAEHDELKAGSEELRTTVAELEGRTKRLLARFPEPLLDIVRPLSQRLPENAADTTQSLSERFLSVVGILKFANKFQREVSVGSEVRTLADGSALEVSAMYVGLGQAYYANAKGTVAGVGRATADGWRWIPANEAAAAIALAIAIHNSEEAAEFVPLPVRIE